MSGSDESVHWSTSPMGDPSVAVTRPLAMTSRGRANAGRRRLWSAREIPGAFRQLERVGRDQAAT